jgi:MoaA/NifB/PqqE/SkfB family radical SAM enzyme
MKHFITAYHTSKVVLLGGELFLHDEIAEITSDGYDFGLATEICTNGHSIARRKLPPMAGKLGHLRISLDGLQGAHDEIRANGSFDDAIETIEYAVILGFRVGVTMAVTNLNVSDLSRLVGAR